jgi:hypothetical protein
MSISFLNPAYLVHKVDYVYYKCDDLNQKSLKGGDLKMMIEEEKEKFRQNELGILSKVRNIPASMMKVNEKKMARYREIERE